LSKAKVMDKTDDLGGPRGTLQAALAHAQRLLQTDPRLAAEQAGEILRLVPAHPIAMLLLGVARRGAGDVAGSLAALEPLVTMQRSSAAAHYELGAPW
jgi:hypothetical protein